MSSSPPIALEADTKSPPPKAPLPIGQLYGRRRGRPLRPGQADALQNILPNFTIKLPKAGEFLELGQIFSPPERQLWLEIGFGSGEHLLELARRYPDVALLGCEPFLNGVASLLRKIIQSQLTTIRIWPNDARLILQHLPDACLQRCFLLFADPWRKARHARRRFLQAESLKELARLMPGGAELRIASDHPALIAWTQQQLANQPYFSAKAAAYGPDFDRPADWPVSRYEEKAIAAGRTPYYFLYVRQ
jgi:tRNA (guanine-N7-)-methyltransferase